MKTKQLVAMAALALLVALPARAAEVVSSNIVGYEKINVPVNKMDIIGVQFQNIGSDGIVSLQDIKVEGFDGYGSDWIKIYDPATYSYTTATFWGEDMGGVVDGDGKNLGPGWGDENQVAIDTTLTSGQAVWTQSEAGGKVVVSGEVVADNTIEIPVNLMTIVANPLPMAVSIQEIVAEGFDGYGSDWIKIYNPDTYSYVTATYWGEDMGGVANGDGDPLGPGWGDENQVAVSVDIAVGQGFWIQSESGGKLVFPAVSNN